VATARPARLRFSVRPSRLTVAVGALVAICASVVGPVASTSAAPTPSITQVEAQVNALEEQAARVAESFDAARIQLATTQRNEKIAAHELAASQAVLSKVRQRIASQADLAYRMGGFDDQFLSLISSDNPQLFLDQTATLDQLARFQAEQLVAAVVARRNVEAAKASYDAQASAASHTLGQIAAQRAHINNLLAQAQRLLSQLKASDRARLNAAAQRDAASQMALRGSYNGPASGRAGAAVRFAYAQLGKPYSYGAAGPGAYDCSGLTMASWAAGGVSLPHNAAAQQSSTRSVSGGDLQPGDLIFFGYPAYHVGIYIGGGQMIDAPHTGDVVRIQSIGGYSSAGRP
jgi:peptidoglycan DL-endopeptidase CwlO